MTVILHQTQLLENNPSPCQTQGGPPNFLGNTNLWGPLIKQDFWGRTTLVSYWTPGVLYALPFIINIGGTFNLSLKRNVGLCTVLSITHFGCPSTFHRHISHQTQEVHSFPIKHKGKPNWYPPLLIVYVFIYKREKLGHVDPFFKLILIVQELWET